MKKKFITVENLSASYIGTSVLHDINFEIETRNLIGIIGPNGAGKSTLIKAMLNLIPSTGVVTIDNQLIKDLKSNVTYIKQGSDYDLTFPIIVRDAVLMGLYPTLGLFKRPNKKHHFLADQALKRVDMLEFKNRQISELSGGQWQRVLIARMLVADADYLFLDEPFTGVDADSEKKIMEVLRSLRNEGKTIIMIYHDLNSAPTYFDEVILLNKTVFAYGPTQTTLTEENLTRTYIRGELKK